MRVVWRFDEQVCLIFPGLSLPTANPHLETSMLEVLYYSSFPCQISILQYLFHLGIDL